MLFTLRHFDTPLLRFSAEMGAESHLRLLSIDDNTRPLLPLELAAPTADGLESWLRHRSIPKNRAYVDSILAAMGLAVNRPMALLPISRGLSLNDCYWVTEEGFTGSFADNNLYDNRFSRVLGQIAFTGYGSSDLTGLTSSPEFTTDGMLPKCWRRINGGIFLCKGGTQGASNTGFEPYSEFYASRIAAMIGIYSVPYSLAKWKGTLCSTCPLFTSKELSFVPVGKIVRTGGMAAVRDYCHALGHDFERALDEMLVFDALIVNTDRHFGNFGFLVDSHANRIVAPAPLFDHGNSLLNFAGPDALADETSALKYASIQQPCVYDDFMAEARQRMPRNLRQALRRLLALRLPRHSRYNLPPKRLALLEHVLRTRAADLLKD